MIYNLPWYCKGTMIAYDVFRCLLMRKRDEEHDPGTFESTASVFGVQSMVVLLLMALAVCLSVTDRVQTSLFCCNMLLLLSIYVLLIKAMRTGHVSTEHMCFSLQFGSCYKLFCCFYETVSKQRKLLVGVCVMRLASLACTPIFPVLYSHMLQHCMHVSTYALVFVFSGEICGCVSFCDSHLLCAIECVVDAAYTRLEA
jgi:hypothetical protein